MNNCEKTTIVGAACELFEVLFHNILYIRKLYPETIFERRRKFGVFAYQSIHPEVNAYIKNCVTAIEFHLSRNQVRNIYFCFHTPDSDLEKYNFQIGVTNTNFEEDHFLVALEQSFRDCLLKLESAAANLNQLPDEASFSIQLNVPNSSSLEFNQNTKYEEFQWVGTEKTEEKYAEIIPVQSIRCNFLNVQFFIEKNPN